MDLHTHYSHLWASALEKFKAGVFELDPFLDSPTDFRRGITLLFRPPVQVNKNIEAFLQDLAQIEPEQYYYPVTDMHVTVMSIISCYQGFDVKQIDLQAYVDLVNEAIKDIPAFEVEFTGITASPACVLIQGFPNSDALNNLRDNIRSLFRNSELEQSLDQRYVIQTAHSTVTRFRKPLTKPQEFIEKLLEYRQHSFGAFEVPAVELVMNDWYQRQSCTKHLSCFPLKKA